MRYAKKTACWIRKAKCWRKIAKAESLLFNLCIYQLPQWAGRPQLLRSADLQYWILALPSFGKKFLSWPTNILLLQVPSLNCSTCFSPSSILHAAPVMACFPAPTPPTPNFSLFCHSLSTESPHRSLTLVHSASNFTNTISQPKIKCLSLFIKQIPGEHLLTSLNSLSSAESSPLKLVFTQSSSELFLSQVRRGEVTTSPPASVQKHLLPCHVRLLDGTDLYIQLPVSSLVWQKGQDLGTIPPFNTDSSYMKPSEAPPPPSSLDCLTSTLQPTMSKQHACSGGQDQTCIIFFAIISEHTISISYGIGNLDANGAYIWYFRCKDNNWLSKLIKEPAEVQMGPSLYYICFCNCIGICVFVLQQRWLVGAKKAAIQTADGPISPVCL